MLRNAKATGQVASGKAFNQYVNYTNIGIDLQFLEAIQSAGINYSGEIIADSKLHRFQIGRAHV